MCWEKGPELSRWFVLRSFAEAAEDEPDADDGWADGTRESGVRLANHPRSTAWERMWGFGFG